jgi:hypothetical protein
MASMGYWLMKWYVFVLTLPFVPTLHYFLCIKVILDSPSYAHISHATLSHLGPWENSPNYLTAWIST